MIFSDRIHRQLKRLARWYLGDELPSQPEQFSDLYEDMLTQFANMYPDATRAQWQHFAMTLSTLAFGDGRAYEQNLQLEVDVKLGAPEDMADKLDRNWRVSPPLDLMDPDGIVPEQEKTEGQLTDDFLRRMTR